MSCIFCEIIKGNVPCYKVYEDETCLAFLDIRPASQGHTLVLPKEHWENFEAIDNETLSKVMVVVKKIGQAIKAGLGVEGYNIVVNNNAVAGQIVPHLHFHIIPRKSGDGLEPWPQGEYKTGEAEEILEKIKIG